MDSNELKKWIEMENFQTKRFENSVWIPLYEFNKKQEGEYFHDGFIQDIFFLKSVFIYKKDFAKADLLNWGKLINVYESSSYCDEEKYISCEYLDKDFYDFDGIFPVIIQNVGHNLPEVWDIYQDIVVALKLYREGDIWICPDEDYIEVIRLHRDQNNNPIKIEIKNEFLKDYLCARNFGLKITWYVQHEIYKFNKPNFGWNKDKLNITLKNGNWRGFIFQTTTTGNPIGSDAFYMHVRRNDINPEDDVPFLGTPSNNNIVGENKIVPLKTGNIVYMISGELWNNELILPGLQSIRIRGDKPNNYPFFKTDACGNEKTAQQISDDGGWLWFNPNIVNTLLDKRDGSIEWYTRETGNISCCYGNYIHFGINTKGLITVFAEDISFLPLWQQKLWGGFNVAPEGGVSKELLMSQVDAEPATTQAAEKYIPIEYHRLNESFRNLYNIPLFRTQKEIEELFSKLHRFRSLSETGFYELAKDLARITADAICLKELQSKLTIPKDTKWGSLKTLQNFLIQQVGVEEENAKKVMAPLFGIYDMRQVDAHLGDASKDDPYINVGISRDLEPMFRGLAMLETFVSTLSFINQIINNSN